MARIRSNRVCFTVNNYEAEDTTKFIDYVEKNCKVKYAVCGEEIGNSGTLHLQGYIHLDMDPQKGGIKFWKEELPFGKKAHFETARGTDLDNQRYCTKDGIYYEKGEPALTNEGIFERLVNAAKISMDEAFAINTELTLRYYNQLVQINATYSRPVPEMDVVELRPWQQEVVDKLDAQNSRQILFVIDTEGGKGKSELAKWLMIHKNAWACQGNYFSFFRGLRPLHPRFFCYEA